MKSKFRVTSILLIRNIILFVFLFSLSSCITVHSDLETINVIEQSRDSDKKVSVFFLFSHYEQVHGYDAIPKVLNRYRIIADFDDIFRNSLTDFSNISNYTTLTEMEDDVNQPKRRAEIDSIKSKHDFTIKLKFMKESTLVGHFFGYLVSLGTITVIPYPFNWQYSLNAEIYDKTGSKIKSYDQAAELTSWVQALLLFAYPFHNEKLREEEIYLNFFTNVFRKIENDNVLNVK